MRRGQVIWLFLCIVYWISSMTFALDVSKWTLGEDNFGPIKIGMPLNQIPQLTGKALTSVAPESYEDNSCFMTSVKDPALDGVSFLISYGNIARIDVSSKAFATNKNIHVGDSEAQVKSAYGKALTIERHHYDEKGHYLTVSNANKTRAIRFETDGNKVTLMYAGRFPEVTFVEGCV